MQKKLSEEQAELTARTPLVELKRAAESARAVALSGPYTAEGWAPWQAAAEELRVAITRHASAYGVNRVEVESWVTAQVLHPEVAEPHGRTA